MDEFINIPKKGVVVIVSKRGTGKTNLVREYILANIKNGSLRRHNIIVWSGTAATSQDFDFLPPNSVRKFDSGLLMKIIRWNNRRIELFKKRSNRTGTKCQMVGVLHIFDDVLTEQGASIMQSAPVRWLIAQGRHSYQSAMFAVQHPKGLISPILRGNADYILMSKLNQEQLRVCFQLVSFDGSFSQFRTMMNGIQLYSFKMYSSSTSEWTDVRSNNEHQQEKYRVQYASCKKKECTQKEKSA